MSASAAGMMLVQQQLTVSGCERRRKLPSAISPYASPWSASALWLMARPFARECTSGPINIMTVPTSTMHETTALAVRRLRAAVLGHRVARSASIHTKVNIHVRYTHTTSLLASRNSRKRELSQDEGFIKNVQCYIKYIVPYNELQPRQTLGRAIHRHLWETTPEVDPDTLVCCFLRKG